jgi:hypothetical protein
MERSATVKYIFDYNYMHFKDQGGQ